ncbi:hypothetical protein ST201phi2-1p186 [Pseudomonas phage 201phi2-1]|uniref:Uncharacterized protein n=1 Tax=Pseudomonas phage 201phi2-1 TaxID=198110 RepID=B3FJ49_BP201|nr:hypothetical protein ST201phi2-1p186 [Pseudomonas phage 201phi2-1]ABY63016.1 hypothetical protein 201phi2-1p186 [Pseudomonas phage 201phi2-1]
MIPYDKLEQFVTTAARDNARQWVAENVTGDAGTKKVAEIIVAKKIEEIVRNPANENYGFRVAHLYLMNCTFDGNKLIHTDKPLEPFSFIKE